MHQRPSPVLKSRIVFCAGIGPRTAVTRESDPIAHGGPNSNRTRRLGWRFFAGLCLAFGLCGCGGFVIQSSSGTVELAVQDSVLAFGDVPVSTISTKTLTLTSSGTAALTISSVTLAGSAFEISGATLPATLKPSESITLQISFDPTTAGEASGTITISTNSSNGSTSTVSLTGSGTAAASPQLTLSTGAISFGSVTLNTTSTRILTLTSSGTAALTVNSVKLVGTGFTIAGANFPATLNPGQSVTVQVSFDPTVAGAASGTITISSNSSSGSTSTVSLTGSGTAAASPQLTLSASAISFGNVNLNTTSTRTLTLTSSGTAALGVNSVKLVGTGFAISRANFPATLNPGQSVTVQVSFDPTVAGAASGTITISSNSSSGSTAEVSLSGTGISPNDPMLTLSATTLMFGDDPVGTPVTLSVTLTSTGTSPVTISAASLNGSGFTFSGAAFPVTLNPTIAITIRLQFDPTSVGAASGTLTLNSNSSTGSTSLVTLTGTGTAVRHRVTLNWTAAPNSPVAVSGYNMYRATGTTSFQLLNPLIILQTTYVDQNVVTATTYTYYVTSVDADGTESSPSNLVTVTIP